MGKILKLLNIQGKVIHEIDHLDYILKNMLKYNKQK